MSTRASRYISNLVSMPARAAAPVFLLCLGVSVGWPSASTQAAPRSNPVQLAAAAAGEQAEPFSEKARRSLSDAELVVKAKAVLFDQKQIASGHLRVRSHDGILLVDGFTRTAEEEQLIKDKLLGLFGAKDVHMSCCRDAKIDSKTDYTTRFSEQAKDTKLAVKIRAAMVDSQFHGLVSRDTHLVAVDVFLANARAYIVTDDEAAVRKVFDKVFPTIADLEALDLVFCTPAKE